MKTRELRLGNLVKCPTHEIADFSEVIEIGLDEVVCRAITDKGIFTTGMDDLNFIEPIQITSEWLVNKFGFKDNGGGYYQHPEYNFFLFHIEEDDYFECYKQVSANDDTGDFKTLQHIHKLQNLFYELFDEELND